MSLNDYLPDCPICYDPLSTDLVTSTSCGHVFHKQCIDKWMHNDNICPICRRVIKNKIKILFDFKQGGTVMPLNLEGDAKILYDTQQENLKLQKELKILIDEKVELEEKFKNLNENVIFFTTQFQEVNNNVKEYKNKLIGMSYRLGESETECRLQKEELEKKEIQIKELEAAKNELEEKFGLNKEVIDLMSKLDEVEKEFNLKETINDFLKKNDGFKSLTTFIFVLHQKIKNYQEEIENLKKQKYNLSAKKDQFINEVKDRELLALINENSGNMNNILSRKRKFTEISNQQTINDQNSIQNNLPLALSNNSNNIPARPKISPFKIPSNSGGIQIINSNPIGANKNSEIIRTEKNDMSKIPNSSVQVQPIQNYKPSNKIIIPQNQIKLNPFIPSNNNKQIIGNSVNISNPNTTMIYPSMGSLIRPQFKPKDSMLKK